jgi:hypothetical protein
MITQLTIFLSPWPFQTPFKAHLNAIKNIILLFLGRENK